MQIMKCLIFTLVILLSLRCLPGEIKCEAVKWPYQTNQTQSDIHNILKINPFNNVLFYYFYEVTAKKPVGIENELFKYLSFNSPNKLVKGFIEAINWSREGKKPDKRLKLEEICTLYRKTIEHPENSYHP